jgi:hypothetical protein
MLGRKPDADVEHQLRRVSMKTIASFLPGAVLMALALSGCAGPAAHLAPTGEPTPSTVGDGFLCNGLSISRGAVERREPVSSIEERGRIALSEATWDDGSPVDLPPEEDWYVAIATDDLVAVMRDVEVEADSGAMRIIPDREVLTVRWVDGATNLSPGWYVETSGMCALTVDLGDLNVPAVELQTPPDPTSPELRLLVTEETCNSGEDAEGRIEVVSLEETDDRVSLVLGVRPRAGIQACPSNPPTPFTVTLAEPLGDREVVNASLADPRKLPLTRSQSPALPTDAACEQTPLMLQIAPSTPRAGETVTVTTTPEHCAVTDVWEGEVIVRLESGDIPTGSRVEKGSTQPVVVTIPSGITGTGYIMLVPDRDCEDVFSTADCHYPFAEVTIEAPTLACSDARQLWICDRQYSDRGDLGHP